MIISNSYPEAHLYPICGTTGGIEVQLFDKSLLIGLKLSSLSDYPAVTSDFPSR